MLLLLSAGNEEVRRHSAPSPLPKFYNIYAYFRQTQCTVSKVEVAQARARKV